MLRVSTLWKRAEVNPENGKALTIPVFNLIDVYGRCFFLSWIGFFVAFLSWFAFPPLMEDIQEDLHLTPAQVGNSNIVGLCSTLIARFVLGPLCERFGPRWVMAGTLFVGAVPTAFVPLVNNMQGIYAIRFFIGLLGGTFITCQFWINVFFDKKIYGRAAALAAGWGNAGGGVAFFVMPAIMRSFHNRGYSFDKSWKYTFDVCPFIIIMFVSICTVIFGADCPEGRWSQRSTVEQNKIEGVNTSADSSNASVNNKEDNTDIVEKPEIEPVVSSDNHLGARISHSLNPVGSKLSHAGLPELGELTDKTETIEKPGVWDTFRVSFSFATMLVALPYAVSFGIELAVESIISALYLSHSKRIGDPWSKSLSGNWGAMLGLLNVVSRPVGGLISDLLFARFNSSVAKKYWMLACIFMTGVFLLYTGLYTDISMPGLIVSVAFMSWFVEMANGAVYSMVPHINPHHTGIVSGTTGSFGNVGGVLFSLAFRFSHFSNGATDYQSPLWHLGIVALGVSVLCIGIPVKYKN